jgi:cob(I)alamin adenosyltransferase
MTASLADLPQQPWRNAGQPRDGAAQRRPPLRLVPRPEGLLQIHTAPFRGSVAAVFSQALRSAGLGSRVLISQFLKGGVDQGVEGSLWLCGRLQWLRPATPYCLDQEAPGLAAAAGAPPALDSLATGALEAVRAVWAYSREQLMAGAVDLLVLDELGLAIELGYLAANEVTDTLERRPAHLDVILTGPAMPEALMAMADQVTELRRAP